MRARPPQVQHRDYGTPEHERQQALDELRREMLSNALRLEERARLFEEEALQAQRLAASLAYP